MSEEDAYLELNDTLKEYKDALTSIQVIINNIELNPFNNKAAEIAISKIKNILKYLGL